MVLRQPSAPVCCIAHHQLRCILHDPILAIDGSIRNATEFRGSARTLAQPSLYGTRLRLSTSDGRRLSGNDTPGGHQTLSLVQDSRENLAKLPEQAPIEPTICGLAYPGRRHSWSGTQESCKTWAALIVALEHIRDGGVVLHVDFEMFECETRDRLRQLGASEDELARFLHVEPETPSDVDVINGLVDHHSSTLVIVDAAAGAYDLQDLDDNKRQDAERFARWVIDPFRARGVATIVLDHVTKNADTRGKYAIGSERKTGGTDVHLGFDARVSFGRGRAGLVKIATHKTGSATCHGRPPSSSSCAPTRRPAPSSGHSRRPNRPTATDGGRPG